MHLQYLKIYIIYRAKNKFEIPAMFPDVDEELVYDEGTETNDVNVPHSLHFESVKESKDMEYLSDLTTESFAGVKV